MVRSVGPSKRVRGCKMSIIADVLENYRYFSRRRTVVVNPNRKNVTDERKWKFAVVSGKFSNCAILRCVFVCICDWNIYVPINVDSTCKFLLVKHSFVYLIIFRWLRMKINVFAFTGLMWWKLMYLHRKLSLLSFYSKSLIFPNKSVIPCRVSSRFASLNSWSVTKVLDSGAFLETIPLISQPGVPFYLN